MSDRPNILYVHSHDTGRFIEPYGAPVATPRLRRLADEGVTFRQAFCAAPTCSPSRAALLTGRSPHEAGMLGLLHRGWSLREPGQHLAAFLRGHGYETARAGVQHVCENAAAVGYEHALTGDGCGALLTRQAVKEFLQRQHDRPFFLAVGFGETHRAGRGFAAAAPTPERLRHVAPLPGLPDTPETRRDAAEFHDSCERLDRHVGDVLDQLQLAGHAENTLVVCTTDHGVPFPGHKCSLKASGTGVMLLMRGPGGFTGGRVVDALVGHVDLFPTIVELLGVDPPPGLTGRSLLPLVDGRADAIRDQLFTEVSFHASFEPMRGCRTPRWSYIRRFGDRLRPVPANTDDGLSKDAWLGAGGAEQALRARSSTTSRSTRTNPRTVPRIPPWSPWSAGCASGSTAGCATPTTRCCSTHSRSRPTACS